MGEATAACGPPTGGAGRCSAGRRRGAVALLALGFALSAGAAPALARGPARIPLDDSYREWARGPVRWLMLPEEQRAFRRVRNDRDAAKFIEDFWRRRDPDPDRPGNPAIDRFWERVAAADQLYGDGPERGSLTERGRALLLLGPPPTLRLSHQAVPHWDPRRPAPPAAEGYPVRQVVVERWEYDAEALGPELAALLLHETGEDRAALSFLIDDDRVRLTEGERVLDLAARALVRATDTGEGP